MNRVYRFQKKAMMMLVGGAMLWQLGCTSQDVQNQFAAGTKTFLNGLFNVFATSVTNNLFGIN